MGSNSSELSESFQGSSPDRDHNVDHGQDRRCDVIRTDRDQSQTMLLSHVCRIS